ncbi:hypothetical protein [Catenulispora rubra]|uniref:hypothetical protein n=1 Tax=Catenulispora rubra TaxID=280293 RepID=UPI0018920565|nr:hypothetical protein [Catenulispora rubra]
MPKGLAQMGHWLYVRRLRDQRVGLAPLCSGDDGLLHSGFIPCLLTVLRLAVHHKEDKSAGMDLASVLVRAGHLTRAVELLGSEPGRSKLEEDLVRLVQMAGAAGDLDGAQALAESLTDRSLRDNALVGLVPAMARAGARERAAALAETVRYPHNWPRAWAGLAEAVADCGDFPAALGYAARAAECAGGGAGLGRVLLTSMEIAHAAGDHVLAGTFADRVEDLVRRESLNGNGQRALLVAVLEFEARNGDLERFDAVLRSLARAAAAEAAEAEAAEAAEAEAAGLQEADDDPDVLCLRILARPRPLFDPAIVADLLEAVTETVDRKVALALADRGEELLRSDAAFDSLQLRQALIFLLTRHGQVERAMALVDWIVEPYLRAARQAEIVEALAWSGYPDQAEVLARGFADRWARSRALMAVVGELARQGDTARAEALIPAIPDRWGRGEALIDVVVALARQGEQERAENLAHTILLSQTRARALAELVGVSDPAGARRLAARAVFLGGWALVLEELEEIAPGGALAIADEVMTWREVHSPTEEEAGRRRRTPGRRR